MAGILKANYLVILTSSGWVTVTHPHHPLYGQQVEIVRVRRGPDPDLIIRHLDGYHGAIAASWTTYASAPEKLPSEKPPLLDLEGLCQLARLVEHLQERGHALGRIGYDRTNESVFIFKEGSIMGPDFFMPIRMSRQHRSGRHSRPDSRCMSLDL